MAAALARSRIGVQLRNANALAAQCRLAGIKDTHGSPDRMVTVFWGSYALVSDW